MHTLGIALQGNIKIEGHLTLTGKPLLIFQFLTIIYNE